jgi:hypothetical protein
MEIVKLPFEAGNLLSGKPYTNYNLSTTADTFSRYATKTRRMKSGIVELGGRSVIHRYSFPGDLLRFRVEPETRAHYFHCYVWPYLKQMRAYVRQVTEINPRRAQAVTLDYTRYHIGIVPRGLLGEIHFAKRALSHDYIGHEALHATLVWSRWKRIGGVQIFDGTDKKSAQEERLAYALGNVCHQITTTLHKYGYETM